MIELSAVTVRLGPVTVFDRFDLAVEPHERVAIVGPSGTGKTTLLRLIAGLAVSCGGSVRIGGRDASDLGPHQRGIGYVPQSAGLFPTMDVRGNVAYGLANLPREQRAGRVDATLASCGLMDLADRAPHELSGGQARRVALARALAPRPSRLLLDEPLAHLDPNARDDLLRLIDRIVDDSDASLVFVTHDRSEAERLRTRLVVLER